MLEHLGSILPVLVQYWQLSLLTGGLTRQLRSPPLSSLAFSLLIKHCSWQRALMSWERCQVRLSLRRSAQGSSIQRSSILIRWPRPWSGSLSGACLPITRGGILTSESYALVAGLAGAGLATAGPSVILWGGWLKVLIGLFFSIFLGFLGGLGIMVLLCRVF